VLKVSDYTVNPIKKKFQLSEFTKQLALENLEVHQLNGTPCNINKYARLVSNLPPDLTPFQQQFMSLHKVMSSGLSSVSALFVVNPG